MAASSVPPVYSLYIINKSGGLIFQADFSKDSPKLSMNDHLRLGSTFHGQNFMLFLYILLNFILNNRKVCTRSLQTFLPPPPNQREFKSWKEKGFDYTPIKPPQESSSI